MRRGPNSREGLNRTSQPTGRSPPCHPWVGGRPPLPLRRRLERWRPEQRGRGAALGPGQPGALSSTGSKDGSAEAEHLDPSSRERDRSRAKGRPVPRESESLREGEREPE